MNPSDYTGCDIDKMQLEDNENYQNRYHNKSVKDYSSDVGKGPKIIADLLKLADKQTDIKSKVSFVEAIDSIIKNKETKSILY